eukprot:670679-Hanusia_phi.AAC.1
MRFLRKCLKCLNPSFPFPSPQFQRNRSLLPPSAPFPTRSFTNLVVVEGSSVEPQADAVDQPEASGKCLALTAEIVRDLPESMRGKGEHCETRKDSSHKAGSHPELLAGVVKREAHPIGPGSWLDTRRKKVAPDLGKDVVCVPVPSTAVPCPRADKRTSRRKGKEKLGGWDEEEVDRERKRRKLGRKGGGRAGAVKEKDEVQGEAKDEVQGEAK